MTHNNAAGTTPAGLTEAESSSGVDKLRLVEEAARWFVSTFPDVTNYEAAYDCSKWALLSMPYIRTREHFLLACKLSIVMIWSDSALMNSRESCAVADALLGKPLPRDGDDLCRKMVALLTEFADICALEENYRMYREYMSDYFQLQGDPESTALNNYHRRVRDTGMMPFYAITADSHRKRLEITEKLIEYGIYSTAIDNRVTSFTKEIAEAVGETHNPLVDNCTDDHIGCIVDRMFEHYDQQYNLLQFDFFDVIALQGRMGSLIWSLQTKRYGQLMKNALRENTRENLMQNIKSQVFREKGYYGFK
jgi:hypothetical protein